MTRNPLRRMTLGAAATVGGIVLLLALKPHSAPAPALAADPAPAAAGPSASARPTGTRTVTGDAIDTRYGPVQLKVALTDGRITAVTAVQMPSDSPRDQEIASYAVPQLTREAITAQSARIDAVSGATYTSDGYVRSLQSALDRAR
ncbi:MULTISPECIES: FMN-binding protein [Streptomycetaceae]|uniref:FMN-binding domain-containing protein n=1 Tax=Streptantibioticus cattleyicolor (strain ATCC 35852 / DSM 46488 / JCM 4925 / NBRC 14057 / NRRL 8057) TaxID=1003195 RepID=G8X0Y9_STREN|nr:MULTISPECIES: FMN-binding protein [Streptomycetaceae]AEW97617.1 FMN-binding domain-containing protein [Streptantibioticus cattleyicolor NRRL 8057 = DSM 46488]MYS62046.1 FMN-binding protein [Streptomyces sp. SID5468]